MVEIPIKPSIPKKPEPAGDYEVDISAITKFVNQICDPTKKTLRKF